MFFNTLVFVSPKNGWRPGPFALPVRNLGLLEEAVYGKKSTFNDLPLVSFPLSTH